MSQVPVNMHTRLSRGIASKIGATGIMFKRCRQQTRFLLKSAVTACVAGALLSACAEGTDPEYGDVGYVSGFYGGLSVDEPTAALVGRNVLTAGGNAVDAAVAMSFALSVTYPSEVSLGGGGVCIVHDTSLGLTEVIDFIPPAGSGSGERPSAIPTMVRGMAALHARYGQFPWRAVVSPSERLARLGHRVSRAFAADLTRAAAPLSQEPTLRAVFAPNGRLLGEGDRLVQPDLSGILGQIRANGAGAFYSGQLARRIVEGVRAVGGTLTYEELNAYTPAWRSTVLVPFDSNEAHFAPPPAAGGPLLASMWRMLTEGDRYEDANASQRSHLIAEVMKRALADRRNWLAEGFASTVPVSDIHSPERVAALMANYSASQATRPPGLSAQAGQVPEVISGTGFVVLDRLGMAIACNLTQYNSFGNGRIADETGIILAAAPGLRGRNPLSLSPVMVITENTLNFRFAAASGGGPLAPASLIEVMAQTLLGDVPVEQAVAAPRLYASDAPDTVLVEEQGGNDLAASLVALGHPVSRFNWQGRVTALHCPNSFSVSRREGSRCGVVADPRGFGLAPFSNSLE